MTKQEKTPKEKKLQTSIECSKKQQGEAGMKHFKPIAGMDVCETYTN